ncbi:MAG: type III ribulose-bisphosphate carboxylase [Candidatus Nanohaloarchaea archaeon]|nr:type III ribulose-bisphosphate carboxylase [Candidatus Nanohaloarchaea archaeon]
MEGLEYTDFIDEGYEPGEEELVCDFYLEHDDSVDFAWAAGAIAAESSIGTWEPGLTTMTDRIREIGATVFRLDTETNRISVAYPPELFEAGNLPQILSSITGNIYGLEELERLRLLDVAFPETVAGAFHGPQLGIEAVKDRAGVSDRPLVGTIVKPKLGLHADEHASVAYESWSGGLDIVKDDENLASMQFNQFDERVRQTLAAKEEAEDGTGEPKIYFPNITAPVAEMKRRADLVADHGGGYVMIDILTAGWAAVQEMRAYLEGRDIGIHAHRAQHAAYTRLDRHGISMLSIATFARLVGVDNLHAGSIVGKMEGGKEEVQRIYDFLRSDWHGMNTTIPVASGGLHPGLVPDLVELLGTDIVVQAGGGVHGHPDGSRAGGEALRAAAEAAAAGVPLEEKADEVAALADALEKWGREPT